MDFDTAVLLALTVLAYLWFYVIRVLEEKKELETRMKEERERRERAERLKKLYGKP